MSEVTLTRDIIEHHKTELLLLPQSDKRDFVLALIPLALRALDMERAVPAILAERDRLREALRPFADEAAQYDLNDDDRIRDDEEMTNGSDFSVGELRRARAAIGDAT
jgi:hypothetical protein